MNRRYALYAFAALPLAQCGIVQQPGGGTTTVQVTLANVQAEAKLIMAVLDQDAPAVISALPANVQRAANLALQAADRAILELLGVPADSPDAKALAQAALQGIAGVVALVPLPPPVQIGIQAGLILIAGLVSALPSVTVTTPPAPPATTMAVEHRGVKAPIPISVR
jgi:hypothetical protein